MPAPGPATLGRGVVVHAGFPPPPGWSGAPTVTIDESVLTSPGDTVRRLHAAWASREPIVIALAVDPQRFRQPPSFNVEPWRLAPDAEAWFDRLHFLTWANTYDARTEVPDLVVGRQGRPPRRGRRGDTGRAGRHRAARRLTGMGRRRAAVPARPR